MRTRAQVSAEKLRGGFYTPDALVDRCLERAAALATGHGPLRVLEPSAGDGAFVRGLARSPLRDRVAHVTAIEPLASEAAKATRSLDAQALPGAVRRTNLLEWAATTHETYDVAVGNPPFVRFQFVSAGDRAASATLAERLGVELSGVTNLWIGVLMGALSRLIPGGGFAFVVPAECLTGVSAGALRAWLLRTTDALQFDHFGPGSFPGVLQEIGVLSGRRAVAPRRRCRLRFVEHDDTGRPRVSEHDAAAHAGSWSRYLLAPAALEALAIAAARDPVRPLGEVVAFEVSTVTGANDFFCVDAGTAAAHELAEWSLPLLPRIRHAPGLVLTTTDLERARRDGARTELLDFSRTRPDPREHAPASAYLDQGEQRGLDRRYKCRIRAPWFRVPGIRTGALLLSKRSHDHPRVVVNRIAAHTTDTIYRGRMRADLAPDAVSAGFHNSLTLLTAELEGRSFGGGVLELVPSEIARLALPVLPPLAQRLPALDRVARAGDADALILATDALVGRLAGIDADVMAALAGARVAMRDRRFARNRRAPHALPRAA